MMKRLVFLMRKLMVLVLALAFSLLAASAFADTATYTFDSLYATCEISEDYIILTPDNLSRHSEWLARQKKEISALEADFAARGVLVQAWDAEGDRCIEITAVEDEMAQRLFDIDQQTTATRRSYRLGHSGGTMYTEQGYTIKDAEWKSGTGRGRFLFLKYNCNARNQKGYMYRTIRNGYTITLDCQVYGRSLATADQRALDKILTSWKFTTTLDKPANAVPMLLFTSEPPLETNTGSFTVEGTGDPGLTIIGVVLSTADPDPIRIEETVKNSGSFKLKVNLPQEGSWLMTLTVLNGDVVTEEVIFNTTKYQKSLLPVNFDDEVPLAFTSDTYTLSGTTMGQTDVQCLVEGPNNFEKKVKTNNSASFSFKLPTDKEGTYKVVLVFEKKKYNTRRFEFEVTRTLSEDEKRAHIREDAVKPAYSTLNDKLDGYTGRTMGYSLHVMSVEPSGNEWISFMAMRKTSSGSYRDVVVVMSPDQPTYQPGEQVKVYCTCTGAYEVTDEDNKVTEYPSFDLLFWEED